MKFWTRSEALWVVVRVFGFFLTAVALTALWEAVDQGVSWFLYEPPSFVPDPSRRVEVTFTFQEPDFLGPLIFSSVRCLVLGIIGLYLIFDGVAVHRRCVAAWDTDDSATPEEPGTADA